MANHHFGKFADVWKHLALAEVVALERPARYAETHAGSAANVMVDDPERRFGVLRFLQVAGESDTLANSRYRALLAQFGDAGTIYPGSALLAMAELRAGARFLLCDLDPASVADLRAWPSRLGVTRCEVVRGDGMATTRSWLSGEDRSSAAGDAVVHVDPFDPHAQLPGGQSALDLAAQLAEDGHGIVYWYGYDHPDRTAWAYNELSEATRSPLWCGDVMVVNRAGAGWSGDLGRATTAGTGSGIVLANISRDTRTACAALGEALAAAYAGSTLPDGTRGHVRFTIHNRDR